mmetsp:Transcript_86774/g.248964  ORF Transcript_86774/g.248964 Transcript_86774/m.248964 type:complete len:208 (+) Transcript_86774:1390-2013(+)
MPDSAHEADGPSRQCRRVTSLVAQPDVGLRSPHKSLAVFDEWRLQSAAKDAADVGVHTGFVLGVDRGHGVLHVENRSQRRLHGDVLDAAERRLADWVVVVNFQNQVQAIVLQKDASLVRQGRRRKRVSCAAQSCADGVWWPKAADGTDEESRHFQAGRDARLQQQYELLHLPHELRPKSRDLAPSARGQRRDLVQQPLGELDDGLSA